MSWKTAGAAALFLLASAPAWANTSVYTSTGGGECKTLREDHLADGGTGIWSCPAPKGFKAFISQADLYVSVRLARAGQKPLSVADTEIAWHGEMGGKLEWRLAPDGVAVAAILRVIPDAYDEQKGEMRAGAPKLMVMKMTAQGACRVGEIPAGQANANVAARALADAIVQDTPCLANQF